MIGIISVTEKGDVLARKLAKSFKWNTIFKNRNRRF